MLRSYIGFEVFSKTNASYTRRRRETEELVKVEKARAPTLPRAPSLVDTLIKDEPSALHDFVKGPRYGDPPSLKTETFEQMIKNRSALHARSGVQPLPRGALGSMLGPYVC